MTTPAANPAIPFLDVADPAFAVTSAEVRRAREAGWYARTNYGLAVLRYDQVSRLIRHPALRQGSRLWPAHHGITSGPFADWWSGWVLNLEGEAHQRLRRLLNPAFSRRIVEALRPRFHDLAGELVDLFAEPGRCEFMAEFAEPYAARVVAIMLGIAEDEWPTIAAESATIGLAMGVRIGEHLPRIEAALAALYDYADALIAARRHDPRDDLVTGLLRSQVGEGGLTEGGLTEGGLTATELRDSLVLLIFGGFDTTRNQLGLAMAVFMDHPAQWRLLGEHPELGAAAVEEVMRVRPTTTWVTREALADFTFDGLDIEAGTTIHLFCESAGTDAGQEFDITAQRPPHFGFGGGVHYCLGHYVARADMSAALTALAGRLSDPRPAGTAVWLPDSGNTGPVRLPLAFTPATRAGVVG
jgi:cytochrome P450